MIDAVIGTVGSVFERLTVVRQLGIDTTPLLRLFLIECECNAALLRCLSLDEPSVPQDSATVVAAARQLDFRALEAVLGTGDTGSKTFKVLKGVQLEFADENDDDRPDWPIQSVPKAAADRLRSLYVRVLTVRRLAELVEECRPHGTGLGLRPVRFKTRLKNLREAYFRLQEPLRLHLGDDAG